MPAGLKAGRVEAVKVVKRVKERKPVKDGAARGKAALTVLRMRLGALETSKPLLLCLFLQDGNRAHDVRTTRTEPGTIRSTGQKAIPIIRMT
jgi:hypothetical protein